MTEPIAPPKKCSGDVTKRIIHNDDDEFVRVWECQICGTLWSRDAWNDYGE